jgi:hypothetical protein
MNTNSFMLSHLNKFKLLKKKKKDKMEREKVSKNLFTLWATNNLVVFGLNCYLLPIPYHSLYLVFWSIMHLLLVYALLSNSFTIT